MLVSVSLLEFKNFKLGIKTELCAYGHLALSLTVQSSCNKLNSLLLTLLSYAYVAISQIIPVRLEMLEGEGHKSLDLHLLNHTGRCCV